MKLIRTIAATLSVLGMLLVGATMLPAAESKWAAVCCGSPSCVLNGVQTDYCIGNGSYTCCKGEAE